MQDLATPEFLLTPGNKWAADISWKEKIEIAQKWYDSIIYAKDWVRTLNDDELRSTPYWEAVICHVIQNRGWFCNICGCWLGDKNDIPTGEAHRLSIDSYGREFLSIPRYEKDFVPMCKSCYDRVKKAFPEVFERDRKEIERLVKTYK